MGLLGGGAWAEEAWGIGLRRRGPVMLRVLLLLPTPTATSSVAALVVAVVVATAVATPVATSIVLVLLVLVR